MKGKEAIEKTRQKLEAEFNDRKEKRLEGLHRHEEELERKISNLTAELSTIRTKIQEVENSSFRADHLSEESRRSQSEASKQSRGDLT